MLYTTASWLRPSRIVAALKMRPWPALIVIIPQLPLLHQATS